MMTIIMEKCFFKKPTQRISSYEPDKKCKNYVEKHKPDGYNKS